MRTKIVVLGLLLVFAFLLAYYMYVLGVKRQRNNVILQEDDVIELQKTSVHPTSKSANKTAPLPVRHQSLRIRSFINATKFWRKHVNFVPLTQQDIDGVRLFVLFIGYPRSGHSFIGSVIDGHPEAIMAHEYKLFGKCSEFHPQSTLFERKADIFNSLYNSSVFNAYGGWRSNSTTSKGYNLHMTEWHGRFTTLNVIGDKSGGDVAAYFYKNYTMIETCYRQLVTTIQIPVLFIHVVRNPFDMIATAVVRWTTRSEDMRRMLSNGQKIEIPLEYYDEIITCTFHLADAVTRVKKFANVLEIVQEEYVRNPRYYVKLICTSLHLSCTREYIDACVKKAYTETTRSRDLLVWPPDIKKRIKDEAKKYPFFSAYLLEENS